MIPLAGSRYWIVGASEGLGSAVAERMSQRGARLVLSARGRERLEEVAHALTAGAEVMPLDIRDRRAVETAAADIGEIDGVIFLAGVYWPMRAREWDGEKVEAMFDVNLTGAARVLGAVVPGFAARGRGHVVIVGSLSGFRGLPRAIGYGAAKAGLMHLAENLRAEFHRSGVKVQLINPGFIRTRLTDKNDFAMPFIMSAENAAARVLGAMDSGRFQTNFPRAFSWLFRAGQFLPAPVYFRLFGTRD